MARIFIAIELEENLRNKLSELQAELKKSGADVKWVETKNLHLTLKFLGEISNEDIPKVEAAMDEICKDTKAFTIKLQGVGAFPKISYPRVIWVGIIAGEKSLIELAAKLDDRLEKENFKKEERPFSAHLTVGRSRSNLNRIGLIEQLDKNKNWEGLQTQVDKITLFKSTLTPKGPIYEPILTKTLKTS